MLGLYYAIDFLVDKCFNICDFLGNQVPYQYTEVELTDRSEIGLSNINLAVKKMVVTD